MDEHSEGGFRKFLDTRKGALKKLGGGGELLKHRTASGGGGGEAAKISISEFQYLHPDLSY